MGRLLGATLPAGDSFIVDTAWESYLAGPAPGCIKDGLLLRLSLVEDEALAAILGRVAAFPGRLF